jgi:Uma2 family endonuclease
MGMFDPITLKRFAQTGLEPDKCFCFRYREAILGKKQIDLQTNPPPDLALEVDATSSSNPEDYEPLRVPELWIYREESLHIHVFEGEHLRESFDSPTFPGIPVRQLIPEYYAARGWSGRVWPCGSSKARCGVLEKVRSVETTEG